METLLYSAFTWLERATPRRAILREYDYWQRWFSRCWANRAFPTDELKDLATWLDTLSPSDFAFDVWATEAIEKARDALKPAEN